MNGSLVDEFPLPQGAFDDSSLSALGTALGQALEQTAQRTEIKTRDGSVISYDEYFVSNSKPLIDHIDAVLAKWIGLGADELDFVQNFDIKYRMGADADEE